MRHSALDSAGRHVAAPATELGPKSSDIATAPLTRREARLRTAPQSDFFTAPAPTTADNDAVLARAAFLHDTAVLESPAIARASAESEVPEAAVLPVAADLPVAAELPVAIDLPVAAELPAAADLPVAVEIPAPPLPKAPIRVTNSGWPLELVAPASAGALAPRRVRRLHPSRKRTTAFASAASLGLATSLIFAMPANAEPNALAAASYQTVVDHNGHTAAQILDVASNVTMPTVQVDNAIANSLAAIVAEEGGANGNAAAAVISQALRSGGARQTIVQTALSYLGDPYVLDGSTHAGIDCSGLVMVAYAQVGIPLGHLVSAQDAVATPITEAEALPGDVVIFDDDAHIGIYLGGGLVLQAPEPGTPVNIVPVWSVPHHFGRILPAGS